MHVSQSLWARIYHFLLLAFIPLGRVRLHWWIPEIAGENKLAARNDRINGRRGKYEPAMLCEESQEERHVSGLPRNGLGHGGVKWLSECICSLLLL